MTLLWLRLAHLIDSLSRAMATIGSLCAFLIFVAMCVDVIGRELLGRSTGYAIDISELLMVPLVFLVLPYVAQLGANVRLDLFTRRFPPRAARFADALSQIIFLSFAGLIAWLGWGTAYDAYRFGSLTQGGELPVWPVFVTIPLGGVVLCLQTIVLVFRGTPGETDAHPHRESH